MLTQWAHAQERLLSLVAGHLLDANSKQGVSEEQQANMTRIIADTVELLPKLTTGIDVNVMFTDVRAFEVAPCFALSSISLAFLIRSCLKCYLYFNGEPICAHKAMYESLCVLQYTDAIAIFDLLDIHLVHGWLVDPQVIHCSELSCSSQPHGSTHTVIAFFCITWGE